MKIEYRNKNKFTNKFDFLSFCLFSLDIFRDLFVMKKKKKKKKKTKQKKKIQNFLTFYDFSKNDWVARKRNLS